MKKHAIAIIGLVFAALVFGSCDLQKGGTIKVTNTEDYPVNIYITKGALDGLVTPPEKVVVKKTIAANGSEDISIDEDGIYYVRAFFPVLNSTEILGTVKPDAIASLFAGSTVSKTVESMIP